MDKVYSLYRCFGEGDSYPVFDLVSLHKTMVGAKQKSKRVLRESNERKIFRLENEALSSFPMPGIKEELQLVKEKGIEATYEPIHESMTKENGFIYVGSRFDEGLSDHVPYSAFGGFIIEETEIEQ